MSYTIEVMLVVLDILLLAIVHIHSRRIDRLHERISLTTKLNRLRDPWREAEEREALARIPQDTNND